MLGQVVFAVMSGLAVLYSLIAIPTCCVLQVCGVLHFDSNKHTSLAGKVAIVTGSNTGIGKATAKQLAASGATVILACRSMERAHEAVSNILAAIEGNETCSSQAASGASSTATAKVSAMELDLSDLRSVRTFAASFTKIHGRLDILVNNAGMNHFYSPGTPKRTKQGVEIVFGSNFVGHFLLTILLLDLLKASPDGRIVNLSSVMHHFGSKSITGAVSGADESNGYNDSKLAMLLFTKELRRRLAGSRVIATAVNPGFVASDIWRGFHVMPTFGRIWGVICNGFALTVDQGAAVSVAAATAARTRGQPAPVPRAPAALASSSAPPSPSPAATSAEVEEETAVYLQPYWHPLSLALPFEIMGPFAGPRPGHPTLPRDEPAQSAELWAQTELLCSRA